MQGDADSSMFEIVSTADWLQLLTRHAAGEEDSIRCESCVQLTNFPSDDARKQWYCAQVVSCVSSWHIIGISAHLGSMAIQRSWSDPSQHVVVSKPEALNQYDSSPRHLVVVLLPLIMQNNTACIEGAMPDEKVIGDNVLEILQPAHTATRHAARLDSNLEVCHDTIERQEADAMAARLVYTDAEVMVELVAQADFKPNTLNLTGRYPASKVHMLASAVHTGIAMLLRDYAVFEFVAGAPDSVCVTEACLPISS